MFNVLPDTRWPGFRVGLPEDQPGFRVSDDGSVRTGFAADPSLVSFGGHDPYGTPAVAADPGDEWPNESVLSGLTVEETDEAVLRLGFDDYVFGEGVSLIEWADRYSALVPKEAKWLSFKVKDENSRVIGEGEAR